METNKLKKFAVDARNRLKTGVAAKMLTLGFDRNGNVPEHLHPQLMQGGSLWNGQLQTESFYHQWNALYKRIQQKGIREVYEEAAYTWFNRLVAIRILQKNGIIETVLEYVDAARTPRIVDEARMGRMPQMQEAQRIRLLELLDDDARIKDQFAVLIAAYCHQNPILNACFGSLDDYTELLLPNDILTEGGFVDTLNHTEFITDADFRSPELIGWLYQFYISERKDEVFAKKGKFSADEIPAATQIFTPNWIVKYMVQNTIGRIYLDNHPSAATEFKHKWRYLVEPSEPTPKEAIYQFKELTELLVGDLACGSGHILNECFDLLYDLYIYEGYSRREAVENIFTHNLRGVDLDTRAKQLSQFSLLLKACQRDHSFADVHVLPKVLDMPKKKDYRLSDLSEFMQSVPSDKSVVELSKAFEVMKDADSLGSIMKFDISETTKMAIAQALEHWNAQSFMSEQVEQIIPTMELIQTLTDKYAALVMNPPYMGNSNMNSVLSDYVKNNYEKGKADLCTTFMMMQADRTKDGGFYANIVPPSWMFLSTFEELRRLIIDNQTIQSLLHLSRGVFGADFGSVSTVIQNRDNEIVKGTYFRLIERTFQEFDQKHLRLLFEKTLANHDFRFLFSEYTKDVEDIVFNEKGAKVYYPDVTQKNFEMIPGCPIGYWVSDNTTKAFSLPTIGNEYVSGGRNKTHNNEKYVRYFWEINKSSTKWAYYDNAGSTRKYFGLHYYLVDWSHEAREFYDSNGGLLNSKYWNKEGITWNNTYSSFVTFRIKEAKCIYSSSSPAIFNKHFKCDYYALGWLCSRVAKYFFDLYNPTIHTTAKDVLQLPYVVDYAQKDLIEKEVNENVEISRMDWDSHETSWDFESNPLVSLRDHFLAEGNQDTTLNLSAFVNEFETHWEKQFNQLHYNEEELNRQFIEIYGLQDELTPDVPLDEITILQQGEISIINNPQLKIDNYGDGGDDTERIVWNEDVLMKQLISYAVGVWMGRYKLGKKGIHIAHPEPTDRELQEYWYGGEQVFIDDDAIIPILPQNSPFDDNLSSRIADFIRIVFGAETLTENLNCIEKMLGTTIDQYVQKDFWKEHKKMYQNRPIYWLFSSKKGAFKCLAYMHRMDPYTAERVRSNYLLPYIEYLQNQIGDLESRAAALTTAENRKLTNLRKALDECQEYHERLQVIAEQAIGFDLDDGVLVNYAKFGDVLAKIK